MLILSVSIACALKLMTHAVQICCILTSWIHCDITLYLLQCFSNGPMHPASIFHWEFADIAILSLYYSFHCVIFCVILCCNWLKLLYVLPFALFSVCLASSSIHSTGIVNWYILLIIKTVIVILLNGKMIVHKIEFKIRVIIYRPERYWPRTVAFIF